MVTTDSRGQLVIVFYLIRLDIACLSKLEDSFCCCSTIRKMGFIRCCCLSDLACLVTSLLYSLSGLLSFGDLPFLFVRKWPLALAFSFFRLSFRNSNNGHCSSSSRNCAAPPGVRQEALSRLDG